MKVQSISNNTVGVAFARRNKKEINTETTKRLNADSLNSERSVHNYLDYAPLVLGAASIATGTAIALCNEPYKYYGEYGEEINRPYRDALVEVMPNTITPSLTLFKNDKKHSIKYLDKDTVQLTSDDMNLVIKKDCYDYSMNGKLNGSDVNVNITDNQFLDVYLPFLLTGLGCTLMLFGLSLPNKYNNNEIKLSEADFDSQKSSFKKTELD